MKFHLVSKKGQEFLEKREGRRSKAYPDSGGVWSIGIGHALLRSERSSGKIIILGQAVKYAGGLTEQQIDDLFRQDIARFEGTVSLAIHDSEYKNWEQHHIDALVSFCFNIGINAFNKSTLAKMIKSGSLNGIPAQIRRWKWDNGIEVPGLVNRRKFESQLFEFGIYA